MNPIAYRPVRFHGSPTNQSRQQTDALRNQMLQGLANQLDWAAKGSYYSPNSTDLLAMQTLQTLAMLVGPVPARNSVNPE